MSTYKEKYIGESKIKNKPDRKLVFKIGEDTVGTANMKDGAITPEKLSERVVPEVIRPITDEMAATLNDIQQEINNISGKMPEGIVVTGSISKVEIGTETSVTLTAVSSNNKPASWGVFKDDTLVYSADDVNTISYTDTVSGSTQYTVKGSIDGYTYSGLWNIQAVYPFYIGAGNTYSSVMNDSHKAGADTDISGKYSVTAVAGNHIFVIVKNGSVLDSITMNGFEVPMKDPYTVNNGYKVYESKNTYQAGTYTVLLNGYTSSEADVVESIQQWIETEEEHRQSVIGDTSPENPYVGQLWVNTALTPVKPLWWQGEAWIDGDGQEYLDPESETEG